MQEDDVYDENFAFRQNNAFSDAENDEKSQEPPSAMPNEILSIDESCK